MEKMVLKDLNEMRKEQEPVLKLVGPARIASTDIFEDSVCYPMEEVLRLADLGSSLMKNPVPERIAEYERLTAEIRTKRLPGAPERIYLWPEGHMPSESGYTDNSRYYYMHEPDFRPYLFEYLIPEDVVPKGAVVICAGGGHAEACVCEGTGVAKELNELGYQCFQVLNRPNMNPWSGAEAGTDVGRAIRFVRANAEKYRIAPDRVALAGFSNGGLTGEQNIQYCSGSLTVKDRFPAYVPDELDRFCGAPDVFLNIYGPRFADTSFSPALVWNDKLSYPPTMLVVGEEDFNVPNIHPYIQDLRDHGVIVEVHTFAGAPHGLAGAALRGPLPFPAFQLWETLADAFMDYVYSREK